MSCNPPVQPLRPASPGETQRTDSATGKNDAGFNPGPLACEDLHRKDVIYYFAGQQQSNNFPEFDTSQTLVIRGHFVNAKEEHTLVFVSSWANGSCGSCCQTLMLFNCADQPEVIWSGNCGPLSRNDIRDLDGDGILEIESICGTAWMMEETEQHEIFNLANAKKHVLFSSLSSGYSFAGGGDIGFPYQAGDTFSIACRDKLIDPDGDGIFEMQQVRTISVCGGGKTEKEILRKQQLLQDTLLIPLEEKSE